MSIGSTSATGWRRALLAMGSAVLVGLTVAGPASAGPSSWTRLSPVTSPSAREASIAYDPLTHQTVLFGGFGAVAGGDGPLSDTWTWDGTTWTRRTPAHVPPAREVEPMAFDAATGQLLMFSGDTGLADTWNWTGSDWQQLHPATSPPFQGEDPFAYDPATRQLVLYAASVQSPNGTSHTDTWTWDGTNWTLQHPATLPGAHDNGVMAFDPAIGKLVLWGGVTDGPSPANASWAWDGSNWTRLNLAAPPAARFGAAMALDPTASQVILTGGQVGPAVAHDTWQLGTGWTQLSPGTSAPALTYPGLAPDPGSGHLVLFGGSGGLPTLSNQTWVWGPLTVTARSLPVAQTALRYSQTLQATGGKGALSWTVGSGSLPMGMTLSGAGVLSGLASETGTFTFTATVSDASVPAASASRSFTLTVNQGPLPAVYVADRGDSVIHGFALDATANATPVKTLAGPATTLAAPAGLALDVLGRLHVADAQANAVDVFAAGASGNVAPVGALVGAQTNLTDPSAIALDAAGNAYVADLAANTITVYAASANGNVAPIRTITGPSTQLSGPDALTVNGAGDLWVANGQAGTLTEYGPSANGNAAPMATIGGAATTLSTPDGLTQDPAGRLLVADGSNGSVDTFATPPSAVDVAPVATLTGLAYPIGIDVDAAGREFVANQFGGLNIYPAGARDASALFTTIAGPATGLSAPGAVAVLPPLYVTTQQLRHGTAGRRYRLQLRALLGRSPLRWHIARGQLPAGLRLTRRGVITGRARHAARRRITVAVADSTRPAMHARQSLRLVIGPRRP